MNRPASIEVLRLPIIPARHTSHVRSEPAIMNEMGIHTRNPIGSGSLPVPAQEGLIFPYAVS
jgi:hypothetical protein